MAETESVPMKSMSSNPDKDIQKLFKEEKDKGCCMQWLPKRYMIAILTFLGFVNVYSLRVNLSVALVAMVNNRTMMDDTGKMIVAEHAEFNWSSKTQGFVLSSFFYGYILTQIPGGYLAAKYGGKNLFGGGILMTALFTLITPFAARSHVNLLMAVRVLEGIFEGVTFPCINAMWSRWAPPLERSKLATISFSGPFAGTVIGMPLSGLLAHNYGWPSVFYVLGLAAVFWCVLWFYMVTDSPTNHPGISQEELEYIENSLKEDKTETELVQTPWSSILKSPAVWALVIAHSSENWGYYTLLTSLPTYMKQVLNFDITEAGFLSALPYLLMTFVVQFGGRFADYLRSNNILSTTAVRKVFNSLGFAAQGIFLILVGWTTDRDFAIIGLTLAIGLGGLAWSGFPINHLDICPRYASITFGIANCFATLPGMISPIVVGYLTPHHTQAEWKKVFIIASCVYAFGMIIYIIFGSGNKQSWADPDSNSIGETPAASDDDLDHRPLLGN